MGETQKLKKIQAYIVDVFVSDNFDGNPAGVVLEADALTADDMQKIAGELGHSETAFVLAADDPNHDVRVRFFTPATEVPSCGHATIAAHYVRARQERLAPQNLRQKIAAGIQTIHVRHRKGASTSDPEIIMTQNPPEFGPLLGSTERDDLLAALGITKDNLSGRCPVQIVSTGHSKVMICIHARSTLAALSPDMTALKELSAAIGCNGYFVFTFDTGQSSTLTHGRMFAPAIGIPEDPATGNANGPLGAYLVQHGLAQHDANELRFRGAQGGFDGRGGVVDVIIAIDDGRPVRAQVTGEVIVRDTREILY